MKKKQKKQKKKIDGLYKDGPSRPLDPFSSIIISYPPRPGQGPNPNPKSRGRPSSPSCPVPRARSYLKSVGWGMVVSLFNPIKTGEYFGWDCSPQLEFGVGGRSVGGAVSSVGSGNSFGVFVSVISSWDCSSSSFLIWACGFLSVCRRVGFVDDGDVCETRKRSQAGGRFVLVTNFFLCLNSLGGLCLPPLSPKVRVFGFHNRNPGFFLIISHNKEMCLLIA